MEKTKQNKIAEEENIMFEKTIKEEKDLGNKNIF